MRRICAVVLAAVLATACGSSGAADRNLTVAAAASLTEAFEDLGRATGVAFSFAGSQQVVAQVEAGAPVDVVATAEPEAMDRLSRAGLVDPPRTFAANRLAIAVGPGNPRRIRGLADLAGDGLKVVLADPTVPAGRYAVQVLERAGARVRPVSLELDVKAVARKVAAGEADAGIVYATDLAAGTGVAIPDASNVVVTYPVAVVRASTNRGRAEAFVDRLLGPPGRDALAARGFLLP
ncbi:MAG: molybdate ABC transporter substrate-binding protein [Acidimicrobiales bacterium]